jgi:hypothetical protein
VLQRATEEKGRQAETKLGATYICAYRLRQALFPAGGPFLPSVSVKIYICAVLVWLRLGVGPGLSQAAFISGALRELGVALCRDTLPQHRATCPCVGRARTLRHAPLAEPRCAVLPGPRLRWLRLGASPVCAPYVGLGFFVQLRFALRGLALCCVHAIAPSFVSGWRAVSSISLCNLYRYLHRETEEKARQPETKLGRGPGGTAHRGPASGTRRDARARPTQGRVAPAKGNAKLLERPRDEGGPREARPASLLRLVGQVPEQRQGRGPKAPEGLDRHRREGQSGGHLPIRTPLGGVRAAAANPGVGAAPPAKEAAVGCNLYVLGCPQPVWRSPWLTCVGVSGACLVWVCLV